LLHPQPQPPSTQPNTYASGWQLFPAGLTANVGYWATLSLNIPDFTRYARSQRSQALGQALGLPATMTAFAFIGVVVTSATVVVFGEAIWDPVALYTYAWFVTFGLSFALYLALSWPALRRLRSDATRQIAAHP
jgi:cytosine/uracil/thiamine/allantoin permease